jgi:hypothetical protein
MVKGYYRFDLVFSTHVIICPPTLPSSHHPTPYNTKYFSMISILSITTLYILVKSGEDFREYYPIETTFDVPFFPVKSIPGSIKALRSSAYEVLLFTLSGTEMISVPSKLPRLPKAICTTFDMISRASPVSNSNIIAGSPLCSTTLYLSTNQLNISLHILYREFKEAPKFKFKGSPQI